MTGDANYDSMRDHAIEGEQLGPLQDLLEEYNEVTPEDVKEAEEKKSTKSEDNEIYK